MKQLHLYKIKAADWVNYEYVAALSQAEALELLHKKYDTIDVGTCSVVYVEEVLV